MSTVRMPAMQGLLPLTTSLALVSVHPHGGDSVDDKQFVGPTPSLTSSSRGTARLDQQPDADERPRPTKEMDEITARASRLKTSLAVSCTVALIIIAITTGIAFQKLRTIERSVGEFQHNEQMSNYTSSLMESLLNGETGTRGFIITGELNFLQPWNLSLITTPYYLQALSEVVHTTDFATWSTQLQGEIDAIHRDWLRAILHRSDPVDGFDLSRNDTLAAEQDRMDNIRMALSTARTIEKQQLQSQYEEGQSAIQYLKIVTGVTLSLIALTVLCGGCIGMDAEGKELSKHNHELGKALARAEEGTKMKSQFLANMSHEIRTPMNGVLAMTRYLCSLDLNPEQQEVVETILTSAESMMRLIDDLLLFSKMDAGRFRLVPSSFSLMSLLQPLDEQFAIRCAAKIPPTVSPQPSMMTSGNAPADDRPPPVAWSMILDPNLPQRIFADCERLRQVLINICDNAVKFTAHGRIILRVSLVDPDQERSLVSTTKLQQKEQDTSRSTTAGEPMVMDIEARGLLGGQTSPTGQGAASGGAEQVAHLKFSVSDTGIGIDVAANRHIFEPFYQLDSSSTRHYGGTGLGLSICSQLVAQMGGRLRIHSRLGHGAEFSFIIPASIVQHLSVVREEEEEEREEEANDRHGGSGDGDAHYEVTSKSSDHSSHKKDADKDDHGRSSSPRLPRADDVVDYSELNVTFHESPPSGMYPDDRMVAPSGTTELDLNTTPVAVEQPRVRGLPSSLYMAYWRSGYHDVIQRPMNEATNASSSSSDVTSRGEQSPPVAPPVMEMVTTQSAARSASPSGNQPAAPATATAAAASVVDPPPALPITIHVPPPILHSSSLPPLHSSASAVPNAAGEKGIASLVTASPISFAHSPTGWMAMTPRNPTASGLSTPILPMYSPAGRGGPSTPITSQSPTVTLVSPTVSSHSLNTSIGAATPHPSQSPLTSPAAASSGKSSSSSSGSLASAIASTPSRRVGSLGKKDASIPSLHVLLVEDNAINVKVLTKLLTKDGHTVAVANNGLEAVEMYRDQPMAYQVILMDLHMPIMDGLTATTHIRQDEKEWNQALVESAVTSQRLAAPAASTGSSVTSSPIHVSPGESDATFTAGSMVWPHGRGGSMSRANSPVHGGSTAALPTRKWSHLSSDADESSISPPVPPAAAAASAARASPIHIPIVACTASVMDLDAERCLQAGMDDVLTKPISIVELRARLRAVGNLPRTTGRQRDHRQAGAQAHGDAGGVATADAGPGRAAVRELDTHTKST